MVIYTGLGGFAVHCLQNESIRALIAERFEAPFLLLFNLNLLESTESSKPAPRDEPRLMNRI